MQYIVGINIKCRYKVNYNIAETFLHIVKPNLSILFLQKNKICPSEQVHTFFFVSVYMQYIYEGCLRSMYTFVIAQSVLYHLIPNLDNVYFRVFSIRGVDFSRLGVSC